MKKEEKELSIIVPVYNVEKYIKQCLTSLVNQTINNYEIILINDGCEDRSIEICKEFANKYEYIRIISQEHKGPGTARNIGIKESVGKYIAFVDSDDYIKENMFEKFINSAKEDDVDIVICDVERYFEDTNKRVYCKEGLTENIIYNNDKILESYLSGEISSFAWNKIYKRTLFDNIKFEEGVYYEDIYPAYSIIKKAKTGKKINEALYIYRIRKNNITSSYDDKKIYDLNSAIEKVNNDYKKSKNFNIKLLEAFNISYLEVSVNLYIKNMDYNYKKIYGEFEKYYKKDNIPSLIKIIPNSYISNVNKIKHILFKCRILPLVKKLKAK